MHGVESSQDEDTTAGCNEDILLCIVSLGLNGFNGADVNCLPFEAS